MSRCLCIQLLKVIKFTDELLPKMDLATSVLYAARNELIFFTFVFVISMFAFSQLFYVQVNCLHARRPACLLACPPSFLLARLPFCLPACLLACLQAFLLACRPSCLLAGLLACLQAFLLACRPLPAPPLHPSPTPPTPTHPCTRPSPSALLPAQLGPVMKDFNTQQGAIISLTRSLFGDFDIEAIQDNSSDYLNTVRRGPHPRAGGRASGPLPLSASPPC